MRFETERLILRVIRPEDWPALKRIVRNFDASPYAPYDLPFPEEDAELQETAQALSQSGSFFLAELRGSGAVIGYVSLCPERNACSLGYCFHSDYHGCGYAFEACSYLMNAYRKQGVSRFVCGTALVNAPSLQLIKKLGFEMVCTEELSFRKDASGGDIAFIGGWFIRDFD